MFTARYVLHSTFCPHSAFMCFVWISEQTAIISLYSINWLVGFYNWDGVCLLRGTSWIFISFRLVLVSKARTATQNAVTQQQSVAAYWHYSAEHCQYPSLPTAGLSTASRRNDSIRGLPATVRTVAREVRSKECLPTDDPHLAMYPYIENQFDCCNSAISLATELPFTSRYDSQKSVRRTYIHNLGTTARPNEKLHIKLCHCWYTPRRYWFDIDSYKIQCTDSSSNFWTPLRDPHSTGRKGYLRNRT